MTAKIFFRNDDVNTLDEELLELFQLVIEKGVSIDMAVEPENLTPETISWLKKQRSLYPERVTIIQHGLNHKDHVPGRGEFGGRRYEDQYRDMRKGKDLMELYFGNDFFPVFTCPKGGHDESTIRSMNELGYKVFSSYHNVYHKNKILYSVGKQLKKSFLFGKRVSYHLQTIPNTQLVDISMSMGFIKKYHSSSSCEFVDLRYLQDRYNKIIQSGQPVIGITIHHRYHKKQKDMQLIAETMDFLKEKNSKFLTLEQLYKDCRP